MSRIVLSLLVDNTAGVLSRVAGLFSRRGYNIESLTVGVTADPRYSRMTVVSLGDHQVLEQIQKQLAACHFLVADREEEAVAHILVQILFIHKVEAMTKEYLLGPCSPAAIFTHLAHEVIFPVRRRSEHFSEGVLSGM